MISDRVKSSLKREFYQSRAAQVGVVLIAIILFTAVFAPMLTPHDPTTQRVGTGNGSALTDLPPLSPIPGHEFVGTRDQTMVNQTTGEFVNVQQEVPANASQPLGTN